MRALSDVRFELLPGEVHALMGENGAGKSTLMKILAGVYTQGSGRDPSTTASGRLRQPARRAAAGIGIIHQELQLMNHLTVAQNIFIGREPRGAFGLLLDEDKLNREAAALLAHLNLAIDPRTVSARLTVAKQQMVEIAKALSFNSRVLIMDEPTAALNAAEIERAVQDDPRAQGERRRHHLHFAQAGRDEADLPIASRCCATAVRRHASDRDDAASTTIIRLMVGRTSSDVARAATRGRGDEIALEVQSLNCGA